MREGSSEVSLLPRTTDLLSLHETDPHRYPHLLESVTDDGSGNGRFDILFAFPEGLIELAAPGLLFKDGAQIAGGDFLGTLQRAWQEVPQTPHNSMGPFHGGWFLYLSYEFSSILEPRLPLAVDAPRPLAFAERFRSALVRDRHTGDTCLVSESGVAHDRPALVRADIRRARPGARVGVRPRAIEEEPDRHFIEGVERIQSYIAAGDVFQVNLSRRWQIDLGRATPAPQLYRRLRESNPAPFAGLVRLPGADMIISSSPERLARIHNGTILSEPIAGTFPRVASGADTAVTTALATHPKERAEHVMLVDLVRNDLGRVCTPGSIGVERLMEVKSYRFVHHLVSRVQGRLKPAVGPAAVVAAIFPGGTITGCPKLRSMEIIRELEPTARGAYTGSIGYLGRNGDLDLNILIRTLVHRQTGIALRAGAGIVADSIPAKELAETRAKAKGLLAAMGI
ncbi:MAG: aminodeoxychorismate synthase component I [Acidiferrobacteraceae bacterium]